MINDNDSLQIKIKYFSTNFIAVHITKKNKEWANGWIVSSNNDFLVIDEFKKGSIPIFFSDIYDIEKYEVNDGNTKA